MSGTGRADAATAINASTIRGSNCVPPSPKISMLGGLLPLLTRDVRVRFTPADSTGSWTIDDVYVDPLMHR